MFFHKKKQTEDTEQAQNLTPEDSGNAPEAGVSSAGQEHTEQPAGNGGQAVPDAGEQSTAADAEAKSGQQKADTEAESAQQAADTEAESDHKTGPDADTEFVQPAVNEEVDLPAEDVEKALDAELDRELKADTETHEADSETPEAAEKETEATSDRNDAAEQGDSPSANSANGTTDRPLYGGTVEAAADTNEYQEPEQPDDSKNKKEKKKKKHTGLKVLLVLVIIAAALYGCGVYIFQNRFLPRTELNGIDIGTKTIDEANQVAKNSVASRSFKLTFLDGRTETIRGADVGLQYETTTDLEQMLRNQNKWLWFKGYLGDADYLSSPQSVSCDETLLSDALQALPEMDEDNVTLPANAKMVIGDDNLIAIEPEVEGNELNKDNVIQNVYDELQAGNYNIDLTKNEDNYFHPTVRADDKELVSAKDDLNRLLSTTVTLDLYDGSTAQVDASVMKDWLSYDDSTGRYSIDDDTIEEKAEEWISDLADEKDDVEKTFEFQSTDSGTVDVDCSSYGPGYGHKLDQDAETESLVSDLENHNTEEHAAQYSVNQSAEDKVGDTYIELSLDEQHLWYYVDGELSMESDVVTGMRDDPKKRTPKGLFEIEYKERNRILVGEHESYHTPVAYWMRFRAGGFGFHDATWQPYFGGDRWVNHGSHGCCNLPLDFAAKLYEAADVGTPVVIYGTVY